MQFFKIFRKTKENREKEQPISKDALLASKPVRSPNVEYEKKPNGEVTVKVKIEPLTPSLVKGFIKGPYEKKYELDEVGSFVWELCDGKHTVSDIINELVQRYKLHPREAEASLLTYLKMLTERGLIQMVIPLKGGKCKSS